MTIFTAPKGQTLTLDTIPDGIGAKDGDIAIVESRGEFFAAVFGGYPRFGMGGGWCIWEEYGEKSAFLAMINAGGVTNVGGTWVRNTQCRTVAPTPA